MIAGTFLLRLGVHQGAMAAVAYAAAECGLDMDATWALADKVARLYPEPPFPVGAEA